jgi:hypothetical protein|tara:strand:+ start:2195 stop:2773 length:579 start_codon:yes stop_codon:yes gene_type:complete
MLKKIPYNNSAEILSRYQASDGVLTLGLTQLPPEAAMKCLLESGDLAGYISYVSHALPVREGVCWALACYKFSVSSLNSQEVEVLDLVRQWILEPIERLRQVLMQWAQALGSRCALGWLCLAVVWSGGGSIGEADSPIVLPPAFLHAHALLGAISQLIVNAQDRQQLNVFLINIDELAQAIAMGKWLALEKM